jgi:Fic family protein
MNSPENKEFIDFLLERFKIERDKFDRSGVYAYTQRLLAYNSNKIEGSTLTEEQTASLFDNGTLPKSDDYYRVKDVEEMNGHFLLFNKMLDTLDETLSQGLIKQFHYELKSGVFEDRANGYTIGDYKKRPNMIGMYQTVRPENIEKEMDVLIGWYFRQKIDLDVLAEFHSRYESIHPFQDGNGRTGRLILFRECLKNGIVPVVIEDANRNEYLEALKEYREEKTLDKLISLFEIEQQFYFEKCKYFM